MKRTYQKAAKFANLFLANTQSHFRSTPAFVRIIPTDRCNLNCSYCWQRKEQSEEMTLGEFRGILAKAKKLHVGLLTFLGGEPMMWEPLYEAISMCTEAHVLTDLTTNGTLLNRDTVRRLGEAGLDYLNISVDGVKASRISPKNSVFRSDLIEVLHDAKKRYGVHFRLNSVIYKNNFDEIKELVRFSRLNNVQISLGFVVPPLDAEQRSGDDIYFTQDDTPLLKEIVTYLLNRKSEGYPIIDPDAYFSNIFRFIRREKFWECNYPTRYGWINVTPNGKIRSCTKKMDELDFHFLDLDRDSLKSLRADLKEKVKHCNIDCYSNCAYDSYFYTHNKVEMLKKVLKRLN